MPSEREFQSWPDWCKATYLISGVGSTSRWAGKVPQSTMAQAVYGFWHHCAGLVWLTRARSQPDPERARFEYRRVIDETGFNYTRVPSDHPRMGEMGTTLGLAHRGLGELDRAKEYLGRVLREHPRYAPAYTAMSLVYRDEKNLEAARDVLVKGNEVVNGKDAEIHYFLGLAYLEMGDLSAAERHAKEAYRLGYPLSGLKNRLERAKGQGEVKEGAPVGGR